jgi:hypothetical protein
MHNNFMQQPNKYDIKRLQKSDEQVRAVRKKTAKKIFKIILMAFLAIGSIGWLIWHVANLPKISESEIISRNGIHWHPELSIVVRGVKQEIPANIGFGAVEMPMHTHDNTGIIHLEFGNLVLKSDITLNNFFKVWGKDLWSFGANVKMTVNGKENTEYENYMMQDNDKIELWYN